MCPNHHNEIDNKALDDEFTVAVVQRMKADHEARYREAMAGLERIVDTSESITVTYPTNLGAFDFDETMFEESIDDIRRFIHAIAEQPLGMRDLMVLILVHGRQHPGLTAQPYPVAVPVTQIEGVVQIDANEIWRRARHLEEAGLLELIDNESFPYFALAVPDGVGWDIFVDLMGLAKGDRAIIERAVLDLDFSVFDR